RLAGAPLDRNHAEGLAGARFPQADRGGMTRGEEVSPGREGDRRYFTRHGVQPADFLACGRVPDVHNLGGGPGEQFAVGGIGETEEGRLRALDPALLLARAGIPKEDEWMPAGRGEHRAVWRPGQRLDMDAVAEADRAEPQTGAG